MEWVQGGYVIPICVNTDGLGSEKNDPYSDVEPLTNEPIMLLCNRCGRPKRMTAFRVRPDDLGLFGPWITFSVV